MRFVIFSFLALIGISCTYASDDGVLIIGDNRRAATATGDVLRSRGDLARGLGKGSLLRSLSAQEFEKALALRLANREERVEQYYDLRNLRDDEVHGDAKITHEEAEKLAAQRAPNRLSKSQLDRRSGELYWPQPLDHPALQPYRKPIEDSLAKRASSEATYSQQDAFKVIRMVRLMQEALKSIADRLDVEEVVALNNYLNQIIYDARFDAEDQRIDF